MEKFCSNCGEEIKNDADICIKCGKFINKKKEVYHNADGKSKVVAACLAFFLGTLGIHNFYLGYTGKAIAQLLLTLIGWLFFFLGPIVAAIWSLIEFILILTTDYKDSEGNTLEQ